MQIKIAARDGAPETNLYIKIIKRSDRQEWDREVLVLIPGGPGGNHTLYADLEKDLLEYADLVIIDLRGCGYSAKSDVQYCTLDHHIRDIEAVRSHLNIPAPIIHGCSYGAMVALGFAIFFSDNLSKLILSSGAASGDFVRSAKVNLLKRGSPEQIEMANILWEGRFENPAQFTEYYKVMASLYVYHSPKPEELPTLKHSIPYNTDLVNYAFRGFLLEFDYRKLLKRVKIPTLIFSGKNDWITDIEQAELLHSGINGSTLISFDECGHFPWIDQKELFLSNLRLFLSSIPQHDNQAGNNDCYKEKAFYFCRAKL